MILLDYVARVGRAAGLVALAMAVWGGAAAAQGRDITQVAHAVDQGLPATRPLGAVAPAGLATVAGWKAVLVGGNHLSSSHNNAAADLADRLRGRGVARLAVLQSPGPVAAPSPSVARRQQLRDSLQALGAGEACLVFITSHANDRGIYLSADTGYLSPRELGRMVDAACGERPTVLILSGCGTGAFITSSLTGDNRIILTASARGRVSYGATTADRHVNFDRCMIQAIDGGARTWRDVFDRTLPCVGAREAELGVAPSQPQAWFGAQVADLPLPGRL
jgi:hypothetical protein